MPADVACNYRNGRVTVYWDPPPTGGPVTHYLLWQQIDSGTWALTGDPVATGRSYYSYRFAAPADADTLAYRGAGGGARRGGAPLRHDLADSVQLSAGGRVPPRTRPPLQPWPDWAVYSEGGTTTVSLNVRLTLGDRSAPHHGSDPGAQTSCTTCCRGGRTCWSVSHATKGYGRTDGRT